MSTKQYNIPTDPRAFPILPHLRLRYITAAQYSSEWHSTPHTHTCAELFFITGGHGALHILDESIPVALNDLVIINANTLHTEISGDASPLEYVVLGVEGLEALEQLTKSCGYVLLHLTAEQESLFTLLQLMLHDAATQPPGYASVCHRLLETIVLFLLRREDVSLAPAARPGAKTSRECELVRRHIDNHFKEDLDLDQLAALAHINKYYLVHAFKREFGVSPISYLISCRIQESKRLLDGTDHTLSQISQMLGFSSPSYFSQSFRRIEGTSPIEYRRTQREK